MSILSNSLKSLDYNLMTTSSEKFEYELSKNLTLNGVNNLTIYSTALDSKIIIQKEGLKLIGVKNQTINKTYKELRSLIKKKPGQKLMFYGYDLFQVLNIIYIRRKYNIFVVAFIFDSHLGSIENFNFIKRKLADWYFRLSLIIIKKLDFFILFQEKAANLLSLRKPYLVSKPGIDENKISNCVYRDHKNFFIITYFGSLMNYNGIQEMLDAFLLLKDPNMRLRIFGTGDLKNKVIEYTQNDSRIYYGGLIDQKQIEIEMKTSNLLLNLRKSNHHVSKFAYPSKLIEYMGTGIPILSTDLNFDKQMKNSLYILDILEPNAIKNKIIFIKNDNLANKTSLVRNAKNYILVNNNWEEICTDIIEQIKKYS